MYICIYISYSFTHVLVYLLHTACINVWIQRPPKALQSTLYILSIIEIYVQRITTKYVRFFTSFHRTYVTTILSTTITIRSLLTIAIRQWPQTTACDCLQMQLSSICPDAFATHSTPQLIYPPTKPRILHRIARPSNKHHSTTQKCFFCFFCVHTSIARIAREFACVVFNLQCGTKQVGIVPLLPNQCDTGLVVRLRWATLVYFTVLPLVTCLKWDCWDTKKITWIQC